MFRLAEELDTHLRGGGVLVVPQRARAQAVRLARAASQVAAGHRVWESAAVYPAAAWLRRTVAQRIAVEPARWPRLLSPAEEWSLWRECAAAVSADAVLLDRAALTRALQGSYQRALHFRIPIAPGPPGSETAWLFEAQRAFQQRCGELQAADVTTLAARLARESRAADAPATRLAGFTSISPLLQALAGPQPVATAARDDSLATHVGLAPAADAQEELEQIALWCRDRLRGRPDARLLVQRVGPGGAQERLATLISQAIDTPGGPESPGAPVIGVRVEEGVPLPQAPLLAHALQTVAWLAGTAADSGDFSRWLLAPFWSQPSGADRARIDLLIRERGLLAVRVRDLPGLLVGGAGALGNVARQWSARLAHAAEALPDAAAPARTWSERFQRALSRAGWPGAPTADPARQRALLRWHELLEDFGTLADSGGTLGRHAALMLLRELAATGRLDPIQEDARVTLCATLSDPMVRYDGIWVAGLTADSFPAAPQPDPYLALRAQQLAGVPEAAVQGRRLQAQSLLRAWQASTSELVLSAPARNGDLPLAASPLLDGWAALPARRGVVWLPQRLHRDGLTESFLDETAPVWRRAAPLPRGTRVLDLQNICPFRASAELRFGCTEPAAPEPGIPARERGIFVHAALQRLWEELRSWAGLQARSDAELQALIERCVAEAAQLNLMPGGPAGTRRRGRTQLELFSGVPPAVARECRRAVRLITRLCTLERARAPFEVEATEQSLELTLAGATLRMRADRIDRLGDGGQAVLDYKTGQARAGEWLEPRPAYPQLLAYISALGDEVTAMAVVSVASRKPGFSGIARTDGLLPDVAAVPAVPGEDAATSWRHWQQHWRARVGALLTDFQAGVARVDPVREEVCRWCHIRPLCRVDEARASGDP